MPGSSPGKACLSPSERDISDDFLTPVLTPPLGGRFFGRGHTMRLRQYVVRAATFQVYVLTGVTSLAGR